MKIKNLKNLETTHTQTKFFFDTNIWIFLFFPHFSQINNKKVTIYSNFYQKLRQSNNLIISDMIQMSELVNLIIRQEWKSYIHRNGYIDFKTYRSKEEFKLALSRSKTIIDKMLKGVILRNGIFSNEELNLIIRDCDKADFNDNYFVKLCQKENSILITDDFDFKAINADINIYTANLKYLNNNI